MEIKIWNEASTRDIKIEITVSEDYLTDYCDTCHVFGYLKLTEEQKVGIIKETILNCFGVKEKPPQQEQRDD